MFIGRKEDGTIYGLWSVQQWDGQEELPDDDAEVVAFTAPKQPVALTDAETAVQGALDAVARARGYDNIFTACTYATSKHPRFGPEGRAFVDWRDAVWDYCYQALADVQAGKRSVPSPKELLAELPPAP